MNKHSFGFDLKPNTLKHFIDTEFQDVSRESEANEITHIQILRVKPAVYPPAPAKPLRYSAELNVKTDILEALKQKFGK